MPVWLAFLPTVLFAAAAGAALLDLVRGGRASRTAVLALLVLAAATRTASFLAPGLCPVSSGGALGVVALFVALHLVFGFRLDGSERGKVALLAAAVLLLDLVGRLLAPAASPQPIPPRERAFGELHGGLVLLAYAAFTVGAVYAALYFVLYRAMKERRLGFWFDRLPALERLDGKAAAASRFGLVVLSFGLLVGLYSFVAFHGGLPWRDAKFLLGLLLWSVFATEYLLRASRGLRGVRVLWLPLAGATFMLLSALLGRTEHPFWSGS